LKLWNVDKAQERFDLGSGVIDGVRSVAFSPDGGVLAAGGGPELRLYNTASRANLRTACWKDRRLDSILYSPNGRTLALKFWSEPIRLWDVSTGSESECFPLSTYPFAFTSDGKALLHGDKEDLLTCYHVDRCIGFRTARWDADVDQVVALSPDGHLFATWRKDGSIHVRDIATGANRLTFKGPMDARELVFSADGRALAALSGSSQLAPWVRGEKPFRRIENWIVQSWSLPDYERTPPSAIPVQNATKLDVVGKPEGLLESIIGGAIGKENRPADESDVIWFHWTRECGPCPECHKAGRERLTR
jgi:WD40 repeat protein